MLNQRIGIEVKMAHESNSAQQIRDELAEDKTNYELDTNVDTLFMFIYDPLGLVPNPGGFESDLSGSGPNMTTRVVYSP